MLDATETEIHPILQDLVGKKGDELEKAIKSLGRSNLLKKWIHKFDASFFNHLDGEGGIEKIRFMSGMLEDEFISIGQGGHRWNSRMRLKGGTVRIPEPPIDDLPYKAQIEVQYRNDWLPKVRESSMFPENWSLERVQEEIAWVYENTANVGSGKLTRSPTDLFDKFEGLTTNGFKVRIEVDNAGNIVNSYPITN